jgi:signal transduction histidine kinase
MEERNCLILTEYRESNKYNNFVGKYYHFPALKGKLNQLNFFKKLPVEFVYTEPEKEGEGVFYGYGKITKPPFEDKREGGLYFAEISEYKPFSKPVYFKNDKGEILEKKYNAEFYNYNNPIRNITPSFLDALCLDGGIILNFKSDAHLVQVLGEQLIASERVGILELIKNAYDAGSATCRVRIEKIGDPKLKQLPNSEYEFSEYDGPVILVEDFGSGMDKNMIEKGWLRPASTLKTNIKERLKAEREKAIQAGKLGAYDKLMNSLKKAHKGRIPLGEKGVGRFATHRLGKNLIIKTKTKDIDYELLLKINWEDFDKVSENPVDLESVGVIFTRQPISRDYGKNNSGTQIIIYGGKKDYELTKEEIEEIDRTINKLNTPNPNPKSKISSFSVSFECPQANIIESTPIYQEFSPIFSLSGIVDEAGILNYDFLFSPPLSVPMSKEVRKNKFMDLKTIEKDAWKDDLPNHDEIRLPACGEFYVHIDIWYRRPPWIEGPNKKLFTDYLDDYGGISVYRDGINLFPAEWGAEIDWLKLSKRHIKRGLKLSYYNMIGNLEIEQGKNIQLIDKTDREGMLNNKAFSDLVSLTRAIVIFLENPFIGKRNEYSILVGDIIREPRTLNTISKQSSKIIKNIHENYDLQKDPYNLLSELGTKAERKRRLVDLSSSLLNLEKSLDQMQEIRELLTEQAGFGLGIAVAIHEIAKTASNFYNGVAEIIKSKKLNFEKLEELKDTSSAIHNELKRLSPLRAIRNEESQLFQISKSILFSAEVYKREFEKLGITFKFDGKESFELYGRYGALNQIFTNLFDNACYWLDTSDFKERILQVKIDARKRTVVVADSGPDIQESILPYLFEPGYSLRFPPSGLGLYICKHYMKSMKGDIYLTPMNDRIKDLYGAQFTLDFSRVPGIKK